MVATGSVARIGGPFFAQYSFDWIGPYVLFGGTAGLFVYILLLTLVAFKSLNPGKAAPALDAPSGADNNKEIEREHTRLDELVKAV